MGPQDIALRMHGLSLAYGRRLVLADISLTVRCGEFWCCLGPNGEGKTTLLRALLGELRPQRGELHVHPELVERLGFVPQRCDLNPSMPTTVREFVLLGAVGLRLARQGVRARLQCALARVGLQPMARRSYWALSGGQRQRALVARALIRRPGLLLLDEPTSGLDLPAAATLLQVLVELHRHERLTVIFVTHDIALAAQYATHVMLLAGGRAVAGPVQEVLSRQQLERVYGVGMDITRDASGAVTVHIATPGGPG